MTRKYAEPAPTTYEELYANYFAPADGKNTSRAERATRKFLPVMNETERDDLIQDMFLRCLKNQVVERFVADRAGFGTYFFCIARSSCVNWVKHNANKALVGRRLASDPGREILPLPIRRLYGDPRRDASEIDARNILAEVFEKAKSMQERGTTNRERKTFELIKLISEGMDLQTAAKTLGVGRQTAYTWVRKHLKRRITRLSE